MHSGRVAANAAEGTVREEAQSSPSKSIRLWSVKLLSEINQLVPRTSCQEAKLLLLESQVN
jgi:hypothetical protein